MASRSTADPAALYRMIWRWHFYAGLIVIPFILFLSLTGAIYLFKPQIDAWEESAWRGLPTAGTVAPSAQVDAALAAVPGARFHKYRLPEAAGDAAFVHVGLADGETMRDIVVSPQGRVLAIVDPEARIAPTVARLHGSLLMGLPGGLVVETAASWAIVMLLTGLYLWWPRGRGIAGVLWPRLGRGGRTFWRDLHAVTGFWVAGLALVTLASGLPWTDGWATAFRFVRAELGWVNARPQDWKGGMALHVDHDHGAMMRQLATPGATPVIGLDQIVTMARAERLPFPAFVSPPFAPSKFGPPNGNVWRAASEAQNRPLIRKVDYDATTGAIVGRQDFADKHPIDRAINYGIAWHEGQLFGWVNQLIGLLTALALILVAVSGTVMWWRRRPDGVLGAPPAPDEAKLRWVAGIVLAMAVLLPMLAVSLVLVWVLDRLVFTRWRPAAAWLERPAQHRSP